MNSVVSSEFDSYPIKLLNPWSLFLSQRKMDQLALKYC